MRETGMGRGPIGCRPGAGAGIEDMADVLLPERFRCGERRASVRRWVPVNRLRPSRRSGPAPESGEGLHPFRPPCQHWGLTPHRADVVQSSMAEVMIAVHAVRRACRAARRQSPRRSARRGTGCGSTPAPPRRRFAAVGAGVSPGRGARLRRGRPRRDLPDAARSQGPAADARERAARLHAHRGGPGRRSGGRASGDVPGTSSSPTGSASGRTSPRSARAPRGSP